MSEAFGSELSRRRFFRQFSTGATALGALYACGGEGGPARLLARDAPPSRIPLADACTLTPKQDEGPFYIAFDNIRGDVREKQEGVMLTLHVQVVDRATCKPLEQAAVDIWSANAQGLYSGEAEQNTAGQTFLRGIQMTDINGQAQFTTLYPAWYAVRVNHIHVKVHVGGRVTGTHYREGAQGHVSHTGQLFFPQDINDVVNSLPGYRRGSQSYVTNANDIVYPCQGGTQTVLTLLGGVEDGFVARMTLVVDHVAE